MAAHAEKLTFRRTVKTQNKIKNIMGDKSPKANQKKTTQKQSTASSADAKKKQAVAAKQSAAKKR